GPSLGGGGRGRIVQERWFAASLTWPDCGICSTGWPQREPRSMARFFLKHLLFLGLTLVVVSFLVFVLTELTPGDVARKYLGAYATQEQVDLLTRQMGLERPVTVRYIDYFGKALSGDLGDSTRFRVPVKDIIFHRLLNTGLLAFVSFLLIVPLSMALGVAAGMREGSVLDRGIVLGSAILASIPEFALG